MSLSKRPYGVIVLTAHKLLSVAAVVFLVIVVSRINQVTKLNAVEWIAGIITGLFFLGTIVTGGLLSTAKPMPMIVPMLHKITPYLTTLSTVVTLFLLLKKK